MKRISHSFQLGGTRSGRRFPLSRVGHSKYAILCYHRVGIEGIPYYCTLKPSVFEMQMRYIRENFRVISIAQLCEELVKPTSKSQAVAVTFDDGYSDLHTFALPILRKYEIPATVYLTADCICTGEVAWYDRIFLALQVATGPAFRFPLISRELSLGSPKQRMEAASRIVAAMRQTSALEKDKACEAIERQVILPAEKLSGRMLSWEQISNMRAAGVEFGSHTLSHPVLAQLTSAEVARELREAKRILEKALGEPVLDFAYPFGRPKDYGAFAPVIAKECGYRSAVTTTWGLNVPGADLHTLKRVQLGEQESEATFGFHLHLEFLRGTGPVGTAPPQAHWDGGDRMGSNEFRASERDC